MRRPLLPPASRVRRWLPVPRPRPDDDRGAVAVVVAVMMTVFVGLAALVVDNGMVADRMRQAQSAADAAALAGAVTLIKGGTLAQADAAARQYAESNSIGPIDWNACSAALQPGYAQMTNSNCVSYDAGKHVVRVNLPAQTLSSFFGGVYGVTTRTVAGSAAADYGGGGLTDCVLCILGTLSGGTGGVEVQDGNVLGGALKFNNDNVGGIAVTNGDIGYVTSYTDGNYTKDNVDVVPQQVGAIIDPYKGIPLPAVGITPKSGSGDCKPGTYTDVDGCTTIAAGIYVITGDKKNNNSLPVSPQGGVMFFLTCTDPKTGLSAYCTSGQSGGSFEAAGNGALTITGLDQPGSPYDKFAILVDPKNENQHKWAGKATLTIKGIVYDPNTSEQAGFSDRGNGQLTVRGRAVLGFLELKGAGQDKVHVNVYGPAPDVATVAPPTVPRLTR